MLWAGNAVVGRMLVPLFPAVGLNVVRWLLVALCMAPWCWVVLRDREALRRRWPFLLLIGSLGVGSYNALQYLALKTSSPLNVTLIGASMPMWMMLVGAIGFGQRVTRRQVLGAALCAVGVLLVLAKGSWQTLIEVRLVPGDLLMLLAALVWSIYSWLLARPFKAMQHGPVWGWAPFLWLQVLAGLLWAGAGAGVEAATTSQPWHWPDQAQDRWLLTGGLAYIVIGPSILAYWGWGQGVRAAGPTLAAFFSNLIPVFAAVWAWLLLGTHPQWYHPAALLLIAAGIAVSSGWRPAITGSPPR